MPDPLPNQFLSELGASLDRLVAAGVLASHRADPDGDTGEVVLTPEAAALMEAGRPPFSFPEFISLYDRSDFEAARAWLRRKAAELMPLATRNRRLR